MITQLDISGLAIIDSLTIEFSSGFNVITGETGAGKSILIRALNFLTGAKASKEEVRSGVEVAKVSGEFLIPRDHVARAALEKSGIPFEEDGEDIPLILRRTLSSAGRSQAWINDTNVSSQTLREVGVFLVDVFGQHENQRLMKSHEHLSYLDLFLSDHKPKKEVEEYHRKSLEVLSRLKEHLKSFESRSRDKDYLEFRLSELKKFDPSVEDYEKVETLVKTSDKVVQLREVFSKAVQCLEGDDGSISQRLKECARVLEKGSSKESQGSEVIIETSRRLASEVEDLSFLLEKKFQEFDIDETSLEDAQKRLYGYQDLMRKHSIREIGLLVAEKERMESELESIDGFEANLKKWLHELEEVTGKFEKASERLSILREKAAGIVKKQIEAELQELSMKGAKFDVRFDKAHQTVEPLDFSAFDAALSLLWEKSKAVLEKNSSSGSEKVEFLLASNPGESMLALNKIASGGELSRIMLALKKTLAVDAETCVLVFDEIDTGISGRVADVVGLKMKDLARAFQVICISHLSQVAVFADSHYLVQKIGKKARTETEIIRLSKEDSAKEIARLISGAEVTKSSLLHAKDLIAAAHSRAASKKKSDRSTSPVL